MELQELIASYGQTAFSMAVAWFCLTRLDKSIKENTALMNEVKTLLEKGKEDNKNDA